MVIFVFDLSDRQTFEDLRNSWFPQMNLGKKCIVIGNKADLTPEVEVHEIQAFQ